MPVGRFSLFALYLSAVFSGGCRRVVATDVTGIRVTVKYDKTAAFDQLALSGFLPGAVSAFAPGSLPSPARPLAAGQETAVVLVAESLAGTTVLIRVDGMLKGAVAGSGGAEVTLVAKKLKDATVTLGAPAICGDGFVEPPETCDPGNAIGGNGCAATCQVEPTYTCSGQPSVCVLAGTCSATCTTGCCQGSVCTSLGAAACGPVGGACQACSLRADDCSSDGVCTCGGDQQCAQGQQCIGGLCACNATMCAGCCVNNQCQLFSTNYCQALQGATCGGSCDFTTANSCGGTGLGNCLCGTGAPCDAGQHCTGTCTCDATSCPLGCCDATHHCHVNDNSECGTGGETCTKTCVGQTCVNGSCEDCSGCTGGSSCCSGPSTCSTNTYPNCGNGGAVACTVCDEHSSDCTVSGDCQCGTTGAPCAAGQFCSGNACACNGTSCDARAIGGCCTASNGTCNTTPAFPSCPTGDSSNLCQSCDPLLSDNCCAFSTPGNNCTNGCECGTSGAPCGANETCRPQPSGPNICVCGGCVADDHSGGGNISGCIALDQEDALHCGRNGSTCAKCPDTWICLQGVCWAKASTSSGGSTGAFPER